MATTLQTLLSHQRATIESVRAGMANLRKNARLVNRLGRLSARIDKPSDATSYVWSSGSTIYLTVTLVDLDGFKSDKLKSVLFSIAKLGVEFNKSTDRPESFQREYEGELRENGAVVRVSVTAYIKSDSPTCIRIETGRKTVEVVDYELVCK